MIRVFYELWNMLLSEMIEVAELFDVSACSTLLHVNI